MSIAPALRTACILSSTILLSCCVSAPPPAPPPAEPAPPPPPPAPVAKDWRDWPVAAGDWSYQTSAGGTVASFGPPGQSPLLAFRCDPATRQIFVQRATALPPEQVSGQMMVHTSFGAAAWPAGPAAADADAAYATATRASNDAVFDRIAFSRGRFAIEAPGAAPLAVPNWPEISRVIEDCRR